MNLLIDSDTHLFEPSEMWREYADPADRDVALHMATDDLGYTWLMFGDRRLSLGGPHRPGDVDGIGVFRQRFLDGLPAEFDLEQFTASYSDPGARLLQLDRAGFDASIMFPNYGISWERPLQHDLRATLANMTAWNRWIVEIAAKGKGRLYPVAHLSLRNVAWLESQLEALADGGIRHGSDCTGVGGWTTAIAPRARSRSGLHSWTTASLRYSTWPIKLARLTRRGTERKWRVASPL